MAGPLLFPLLPSGAAPIGETPAYLTDVLTSQDGHEQRIQRRGRPQLSFDLPVIGLEPREAQLLAALLEAGGAGDYLVPLWPYPRRLTASADEGATTLAAGLAGLPRLPQGTTYRFLLLRALEGPYEAVSASAWTDTTVTLNAGLATAWPDGTWIYPALVGHLAGAPGRERVGPAAIAGKVAFDFDLLGGAYAPGSHTSALHAPAAYLGLDVLTGLWSGDSPPGETYNRRVSVVGGQAGKRVLAAQDGAAGWTRTLLVVCDGHDEVEALRAFLDARKGMAVPFWFPTWDEDLTLASGAASGAGAIDVKSPADTGYHALVYPLGPHRRHLQVWNWGHAPYYRAVDSLGDWDANVQRLTLVSTLPEAITTACRVSYLRYVRLDTDAPRIEWSGSHAECQFPVREIPLECPAP